MQQERPHLVVLSHYPLSEGRSMAAYRELLCEGAEALGYRVTQLTASVWLGRLGSRGGGMTKWLGYVDQFLLFPLKLWRQQRHWAADTQVVVSDQALGPWVPWIRHRPHVVICHDLLALDASRGLFPQQQPGLSGRLYQSWIRWGFRRGKRFAAVSAASRAALAKELPPGHHPIAQLANPLPEGFCPLDPEQAQALLNDLESGLTQQPYILHVGGYWYKNREGVCEVFAQLKPDFPGLQLVLVGHLELPAQRWLADHPELATQIHVLRDVPQQGLRALYSEAQALLFPSWMEGFGWPVLEALACGCPVITTNRQPMTEVGGDAALYIPACPDQHEGRRQWAETAAEQVATVLTASASEQQLCTEQGRSQATRFSRERWLVALQQILQPL
jgi:glycosyltransferase involved in cell wall biosynthesis